MQYEVIDRNDKCITVKYSKEGEPDIVVGVLLEGDEKECIARYYPYKNTISTPVKPKLPKINTTILGKMVLNKYVIKSNDTITWNVNPYNKILKDISCTYVVSGTLIAFNPNRHTSPVEVKASKSRIGDRYTFPSPVELKSKYKSVTIHCISVINIYVHEYKVEEILLTKGDTFITPKGCAVINIFGDVKVNNKRYSKESYFDNNETLVCLTNCTLVLGSER